MNKNTRNLIITIIACTLILAYINLVNVNKKEMVGGANPQSTTSAPGIDPRFNYDALYGCMQEVKKMVNSQSALVEIKGKVDSCEQELSYLMGKKMIGSLPPEMNLSLTYKSLVKDKVSDTLPIDKDGIHILISRQEKINAYHCSSNVVDLNFTEKTVSFVPRANKLFIVCYDPQVSESLVYFSSDWKIDELKKVIDQEISEIKKTQANIPDGTAGIDTSKMTPMGTGETVTGDSKPK